MKTWARLNSYSVKGKLRNLYIRQVRILSVLHWKHPGDFENVFWMLEQPVKSNGCQASSFS